MSQEQEFVDNFVSRIKNKLNMAKKEGRNSLKIDIDIEASYGIEGDYYNFINPDLKKYYDKLAQSVLEMLAKTENLAIKIYPETLEFKGRKNLLVSSIIRMYAEFEFSEGEKECLN